MDLNLPSMNSQDFSEQEKKSLDIASNITLSAKGITVLQMYDECYEWLQLDWVKKHLEERWKRKKRSSFEPFVL
jgi:hypothetical protein